MGDPTYVMAEIEANPVYRLAFLISEHLNDNSPIGWSSYIYLATDILKSYERKLI